MKKLKLSLLACSLLASSNLIGSMNYIKNVSLEIKTYQDANVFQSSYKKYNTQENSTYTDITAGTSNNLYFNENSTFSINYIDLFNRGYDMVNKNYYALDTTGEIYFNTTMVMSENSSEALEYFKNNIKITDNSALLDFEFDTVSYNDISYKSYISLKAIQGQTVQEAVQSLNIKNVNGTNAARTLQNIIDNGNNNGKMDGVISALNRLSTNEQVSDAVSSTTPQTTTSSFTAANQISNNVSNIVTQRQNVNLNGSAGLNSGDELLSDKNLWAKAYGSIGSQDDKDGVNGFDIDTYGVGFGIDGEYADDQKIGLGIFYTNADVDVNNVKQSSDIDVYSFIVYGSFPVIDSKSHLLYQLGYSWQDVDSQRNIEFMGTTAKADYTSKVASIDVRLLRDYQVSDDILVQPLISTTYRYFKSPSYSETGADTLNLNVDSFSSSEFILGLGTLAYYKINDDSKLFGNVNVGYDLKDDDNTVTSSYSGAAGTSFETVGIDNGRWNYDLGFGYENDVSDFSNISFSYNFQGEGTDYTNHILSAKYTYKF